jgi:hypothetical protein
MISGMGSEVDLILQMQNDELLLIFRVGEVGGLEQVHFN